MGYVETEEVVDAELLDDVGHLLFPGGDDEVGTVAGKDPVLELLDAVDLLEKVGEEVREEGLQLLDGVHVSGVPVVLGLGRVLHLLPGVVDELA